MSRRAKKSIGALAAVSLFPVAGCFPALEADTGSLSVGLLGVDPQADAVRLAVTAGGERFEVLEPLTPAAVVRVEIVPVGPIALLVETLQGDLRLQSKGQNEEIVAGENSVPVDFQRTGTATPDEVHSAAQTATIELVGDGSGTLTGDDRIDEDAFLAFMSSARAGLDGATPRVTRIVSGTVTRLGGGGLESLWAGSVEVALVADDGGAAVTIGSFVASGPQATVTVAGADLSPLAGTFAASRPRFDVRVSGAAGGAPVDADVTVTLVFAAEAAQ